MKNSKNSRSFKHEEKFQTDRKSDGSHALSFSVAREWTLLFVNKYIINETWAKQNLAQKQSRLTNERKKD